MPDLGTRAGSSRLLAPLAVLLPPLAGAVPRAGAAPAPDASAPGAGTSEHRIASGGTERRYLLVVPPDLPKGRVPVVVVLHGGFGRPEGALIQGGWLAAAERGRFVVVAPEGANRS